MYWSGLKTMAVPFQVDCMVGVTLIKWCIEVLSWSHWIIGETNVITPAFDCGGELGHRSFTNGLDHCVLIIPASIQSVLFTGRCLLMASHHIYAYFFAQYYGAFQGNCFIKVHCKSCRATIMVMLKLNHWLRWWIAGEVFWLLHFIYVMLLSKEPTA